MLFIARSTVDSVLTRNNALLSAAGVLLELPSFKADLSRNLVPPPPP